MVAGLDERFKQPCVAARVLRGLAEHFEKQLRRHELAARARDKIPAGPDKLHALQVEFFIAPVRVFQRLAALGERGRVADDKAVLPSLAHVLPREIKTFAQVVVTISCTPLSAALRRTSASASSDTSTASTLFAP